MVTKIWHRNGYRKVDPNEPPIDSRMLDMFLDYNNAAKCFVKTNNYWFKITKDGRMLRVVRALYLLPLKEWLKIAKDDNFIPNMAGII